MTTIFAPITAIGISGVATIRISGDKALWCLQQLGVTGNIKPNQIKFAKIYDVQTHELIDESVVSFFQAPHSFTGQDVVEISIHGSSYILKKLIRTLSGLERIRMAQEGEFSKIAFLNGKIDLVQAEAIVDLIKSETEAQHRQSLKQLGGELGKIYDNWRISIIEILALIESFIDFPDEDLPPHIANEALDKVKKLRDEISFHLNDNKRGQKIKEGLSLAIIGAPNVGKSSLLNFLAKSEVAIVSEIAGTTRDVIEIHLDIAGVAVKIADTAGIRKSNDAIEQEGIKRALQKAQNADLQILLIDADSFSQDKISSPSNNFLITVLNKIDLVGAGQKNIAQNYDIAISLKTGQNLDSLIKKLEEKVLEILPKHSNPLITQERYRQSLSESLEALSNFSLEKNIELAAEDLRIAAYEIAKITGRIDVDDILDAVFSKFCIGK